MKRPTLYTDRLVLRPFLIQDAKRVQELAGSPEVAATTATIPHPYEDGVAENWIKAHEENYINGLDVALAITLKTTEELIGCISLSISKKHKKAELGYWVGKSFWNNGYCTEAAKRMVLFGFEEFNLNKITSRYLAINPASGRIMKKIGMIEEGLLKKEFVKNEKFHDMIVFGLLKENLF